VSEPTPALQEYREQLARFAAAFAAARFDDLGGDLDEQSSTNDVRRFLVNGFGNRCAWLLREAAFAAEAFDDFPALVRDYIRAVPRTPYDIAGCSDEERFLGWLEQTQPLTDVQRDFITCQRGELAVMTAARKDRPGHVRFQELWRSAAERAGRLGSDPALRVLLNPIRFQARLLTPALAPPDRPLPVTVVFFAAGTGVRTALLNDPEAAAVAELTRLAPCTLDEWCADPALRDERTALARELAGQGLLAFD
jgi:hypothetical protein